MERAASGLARANLGIPVRTPVAGVYADSVQSIIDAGLAKLVKIDGSEIVDGISFHRAPGHSIDHAILLLRSDDAEAVFGGDTLHHPVEIYEPDLVFDVLRISDCCAHFTTFNAGASCR